MWDEEDEFEGYRGNFNSYGEMVKKGNPDIIYVNGAPEDEVDERIIWALGHHENLENHSNKNIENVKILGPKKEISQLRTKLWPDRTIPTKYLEPQSNRLDEYNHLSGNIEGEEEIHFVTSDYSLGQDQLLQKHTMPNVNGEFLGANTDKNSSTERLKRRLYAEALKLSDRF